jgi:hypothetical protein
MTYDDLADGSSPRDVSNLARTRLEIRILEAMGDRTTAQDLRWKTFETTLDIGMLRDHIARLPDFAEFDVLENDRRIRGRKGWMRLSGIWGDFACFWIGGLVGGSRVTPPPCLRMLEPVALAVQSGLNSSPAMPT